MIKGGVNLKTIIVVVILLLVGVLLVLAVNTIKTYITGAAAGAEPKNVMANPDNTGKAATVTWSTDKATSGVVEYGTTPASLVLRAIEQDQTADHRVSLAPLKASTNYYFRIRIGEEIFDNGGIPYSFKTSASTDIESTDDGAMGTTGDAAVGQGTTLASAPTINPNPSMAPISGGCNKTTDYNGDTIINTADYVYCLSTSSGQSGNTQSGSTQTSTQTSIASPSGTISKATPTPGGPCVSGVDYDGNGTVNSMDMLRCKQGVGSSAATP